jgi:hypothetical protein
MLKRRSIRIETTHVDDDNQTAGQIPIHRPTELETFDVESSGVPKGEGFKPPKFRSFDKPEPNSQFRGKYRPQIHVLSAFCHLLNLLTSPPTPTPPSGTKFLGTPLVGRVFNTHRYIRNSCIILIGISENCNTSEMYVPKK